MEQELKAFVAACRGSFKSADKALRGIVFAFRKEWEDQAKSTPVTPVEETPVASDE